jgi:hypothetical protein
MKHPNGDWKLKQTGSDSVPDHQFVNRIPTNSEQAAQASPVVTTRTGANDSMKAGVRNGGSTGHEGECV